MNHSNWKKKKNNKKLVVAISLIFPSSILDPSTGPRGVTFTKIVHGCACQTSKIWLSLYQFLPNFPPIGIPLSKEKHPILTKLGAFDNNLPKIHPIYVIWAPSSLKKTPIAILNFGKKYPKRQPHIRIPSQCENHPPPPGTSHPISYLPGLSACATRLCNYSNRYACRLLSIVPLLRSRDYNLEPLPLYQLTFVKVKRCGWKVHFQFVKITWLQYQHFSW